MQEQTKFQKYLTLFVLGLVGGCIYILVYIKYTFYDAQIAAMGLTNAQSGMLITAYTIFNIILYIPGGILADRLPPKWVLAISSVVAGLTGLLHYITMSYVWALICWAALAFSTAFIFWASLMKAVRLVGTEEEQGFMYGFYFACNGIFKAIVAFLCLKAYNAQPDMASGYKGAVLVSSMAMIIAGILVALIMKNAKAEESNEEDKFHWSMVLDLLKKPTVWICSIVIFCGYGLYSCSSYFTPYLTSVHGLDVSASAGIAIIRNYGFFLLAPLGGLLADKVFKNTAKWLSFALVVLGVLFIGVLLLPSTISSTGAVIYTLFPGAMALITYGTVFSIMSGAGVAREQTGTAIGIASIIGYLPDMFYSTMFGSWLDKYGSNSGYPRIFTFLTATALIGAALSFWLYKHNTKASAAAEQ